jgi:hypothetical protein
MSRNNRREHGQDPNLGAPEASSAKDPGESDKVGYGRPPIHTRFKPGHSGNPTGRPKGRRNAKTVVSRVLNQKITVRENGKIRKLTKLEAMLLAATTKAIKGDSRALNAIVALMARTGHLAETGNEISTPVLPEEDKEIISDFAQRMKRRDDPGSSNDGEAA